MAPDASTLKMTKSLNRYGDAVSELQHSASHRDSVAAEVDDVRPAQDWLKVRNSPVTESRKRPGHERKRFAFSLSAGAPSIGVQAASVLGAAAFWAGGCRLRL